MPQRNVKDFLGDLINRSVLPSLDSPIGKAVQENVPYLSIITESFRAFWGKKLTFVNSAEFICLLAYLESLKEKLRYSLEPKELEKITTSIFELLQKQADQLNHDEQDAEKALACFYHSAVSEKFNEVLRKELQKSNLDNDKINALVQVVAGSTYRYMNKILREIDKGDVRLPLDSYQYKWMQLTDNYNSIDEYLKRTIKILPEENINKLGKERIELRDLYVPLQGEIWANQSHNFEKKEQPLDEWAKEVLLDSGKKDRIMFIQGGAGQGKSSFCAMFAHQIYKELYPVWTPILIKLKAFNAFNEVRLFEERLAKVINSEFTNNNSWLYDCNTKFLFLLDGFDELLLAKSEKEELLKFLDDVVRFQIRCADNSVEQGHRVLITGRPLLAFHGEEHRLKEGHIERAEIKLMNSTLQNIWLEKWEANVGKDHADRFRQLLTNSQELQNLAQEPLLLYLLATMSLNDELRPDEIRDKTTSVSLKAYLYKTALNAELKQRQAHFFEILREDSRIQDHESAIKYAEGIVEEAALCIEQSGGEQSKVSFLKKRLSVIYSDSHFSRILEHDFTSLLVAIHLQPARQDVRDRHGVVEFVHKSFREFFTARKLERTIISWIKELARIPSNVDFCWQVYDLLGYGSLSPVIVEYLMVLLEKHKEFNDKKNIKELFNFLQNFYFKWCSGEFLDQGYPKKKYDELKEYGVRVGVQQVDIYTGLNIMIILFELYRYVRDNIMEIKNEIAFYPCKKEKDQFLRIIGYSHCIGRRAFAEIVGPFLSYARLTDADLRGAYLAGVNLSGAHLSRCNLQGANLRGADLRKARLKDADLSRASLDSA
ncbi:MAG: NACHT domain-containing protein, partial [Candidatus Electrothrix sp. AUS1_2]|nr:NACHT domain-containing protein [Candidatus Electrothrix sp. AUS1_2]